MNYRTNARPVALGELIDRGRDLRTRAGFDPHAVLAPNTPTDPRATLLEQLAADSDAAFEGAMTSPWMSQRMRGRLGLARAGSPGMMVFGGVFLVSALVVTLFTILAGAFGRWIVLLAPFTVVAAGLVGAAVARARNQPRRWLAQSPLRAEGYLELLGREARLVRVRALVRFARGASPDVEVFKDILTGAGVRSLGVALEAPGVIAVHSPGLDDSHASVHAWFQGLCDRALVPVTESWPISVVSVEER